MNNIRVVDNIVQETESLVSEFFGDEDTSFIFTADHGMSNIGNHGDGRQHFNICFVNLSPLTHCLAQIPTTLAHH